MVDIAWGDAVAGDGVRFGLARPQQPLEAGGTVTLTLVAENRGHTDAWLFGFASGYPRSLRVSPPKSDRPHIRVSFADVNVLHAFEAFVRLRPGQSATTLLDLSFAFDRRGVGVWPVAFAYDAVRAGGGLAPWTPAPGSASTGSASTGIVELVVEASRSLREAGIDLATELALDEALLRGDASLVERVRALPGGPLYAAWRTARVLAGGGEASLGWRAMDLLVHLGEAGLAAAERTRTELPHASAALAFAGAWASHRLGHPAPAEHLPFVTALEELIAQPDRRGNFILGWTAYDSAIHGARRLQILGSGEAIVVTRGPHETVPTTRRSRLNPMQMRAVLESLRYAAVWLLTPLRAAGIPDEPRPALEVRLALGDAFVRQIAAWNGEWRQGPGAHVADLLDRICTDAAGARDSLRPSSY
jgi:hypothetical protein